MVQDSGKELISYLETATLAESRRFLRQNPPPAGFSRAFFERVRELLGSNPTASAHLANKWPAVEAHGDDPSYAIRARGVGEVARGLWSKAASSFEQAGRLAKDRVLRAEHSMGAIYCRGVVGDVDGAYRLGQRVGRALEQEGARELAAAAWVNTAGALVQANRHQEAARCYRRALRNARPDSLQARVSALGLSTCGIFTGRLTEARIQSERARALFEAAGEKSYAMRAEANLAQIEILSSRSDAAVLRLRRLLEAPEALGPQWPAVMESLGDAYYALNMWEQAEESYAQALDRIPDPKDVHVANCCLGQAQARLGAVLQLDPRFGAEHRDFIESQLVSVVRHAQRSGDRAWLGWTYFIRARLAHHFGEPASFARHARKAVAHLMGSGYTSLASAASLLLLEWQGGQPERVAAESARLRQTCARHGTTSLIWKTWYVEALRGPESERLTALRAMFHELLQARALLGSTWARTSHLLDKSDAIGTYLAALLERPTQAHRREAFRAICHSRSASLLDEILALDSSSSEALRLARESAAAGGQTERIPSPRHTQATPVPTSLKQLSGWLEGAIHNGLPTVSLVEAGGRWYAVGPDFCDQLDLCADSLQAENDLLALELLSPMVGLRERGSLDRQLASLKERVLDPWRHRVGEAATLSPEGEAWRLPWNVLAAMDEHPLSLSLSLTPAISADPAWSFGRKRVLLWQGSDEGIPHAGPECAEFLQQFPNARVCRTASEVRASLDEDVEWDILHLAAHAEFNPRNPMFSAIQMQDCEVAAAEIAGARARFGFVYLSACKTACVSSANRNEPSGLVRACLSRGASAVVGSAWPLDDSSALDAFRALYVALLRDSTLGGALIEAQKQVRLQRPHPYYWGALTAFAGYRRRKR